MINKEKDMEEIDNQIYDIILKSGRVIGTKEILDLTDLYFQRITYSLIRLVDQEKIFAHGRTKIGVGWQLSYALWPKTFSDTGNIDKHILSEYWPVKIFVPAGKPKKVHQLLFDNEIVR